MEDYRSIAGHLQVRFFCMLWRCRSIGGGSAVWSGRTGADRRFGAEGLGTDRWLGAGALGRFAFFGTEAVFAKIFIPERGRNQSGVKKNCAGLGESRYRS